MGGGHLESKANQDHVASNELNSYVLQRQLFMNTGVTQDTSKATVSRKWEIYDSSIFNTIVMHRESIMLIKYHKHTNNYSTVIFAEQRSINSLTWDKI